MEWWEVALRLFVVVGMFLGAWNAWKKIPAPIMVAGKRYYRQPDGGFRTIWSRRTRDPELIAQLEAEQRAREAGP